MTTLHTAHHAPRHPDDGLLDQLRPSGRWHDECAQRCHDELLNTVDGGLADLGLALQRAITDVLRTLALGSTRLLTADEWETVADAANDVWQMACGPHLRLANVAAQIEEAASERRREVGR